MPYTLGVPPTPPGVPVWSVLHPVGSYAGVVGFHAESRSGVRPPAPSSRIGVIDPAPYAGVLGYWCMGVRAESPYPPAGASGGL